jgi:hypothetical protein
VYLKSALVEAANAAARAKGTYLRDKFFRLKARRGYKRAVVAIAHKILVAIYHMLSQQVSYNDLGDLYLDKLNKNHLTRNLVYRPGTFGLRGHTDAPTTSSIGGDNFHDSRLEGSRWRLWRAREMRLAMEFESVFFRLFFGSSRQHRRPLKLQRRGRETTSYAADYLTRSLRRARSVIRQQSVGNAQRRFLPSPNENHPAVLRRHLALETVPKSGIAGCGCAAL